jgi:hypothetical protein
MVSDDSTSRVIVFPVRVLTTDKAISDPIKRTMKMRLTDLHASTETKNQVQGGLLLNVVVTQGTTILKLLAGEDKTLLVGRDALLVLDLALDIVDGVR